jgi:hypothetical protein
MVTHIECLHLWKKQEQTVIEFWLWLKSATIILSISQSKYTK